MDHYGAYWLIHNLVKVDVHSSDAGRKKQNIFVCSQYKHIVRAPSGVVKLICCHPLVLEPLHLDLLSFSLLSSPLPTIVLFSGLLISVLTADLLFATAPPPPSTVFGLTSHARSHTRSQQQPRSLCQSATTTSSVYSTLLLSALESERAGTDE